MSRNPTFPITLQGRSPTDAQRGDSFLVTFDDGRIYAQPLNRRLTKREVGKFLKTNEDGVAYLAKKGCLKALGHPDSPKQKLFAANEFFMQM